jgi:hypothetical protein
VQLILNSVRVQSSQLLLLLLLYLYRYWSETQFFLIVFVARIHLNSRRGHHSRLKPLLSLLNLLIQTILIGYFKANRRLSRRLHELLEYLVGADSIPRRKILDSLFNVLQDLVLVYLHLLLLVRQ